MALALMRVKGMSAPLARKMRGHGIEHSDHLLSAARTPQLRQEMAKALGVSHNRVLEMANRADLARIVGVGKIYSDLMEKAGVDTVKELANRVPENLHATLALHNAKRRPKGRAPSLKEVTDWVNQAKALPPMLEY